MSNAFTLEEVGSALAGLDALIAGRVPEFQNIQFRAEAKDRLGQLTSGERLNAVRRLPLLHALRSPHACHRSSSKVAFARGALARRAGGDVSRHGLNQAAGRPPKSRGIKTTPILNCRSRRASSACGSRLIRPRLKTVVCVVLPGWHRRGARAHFQLRDWQLCDAEMDGLTAERVAVPLAPGGCLIFDSFLPHGTPSNFTAVRRRALQFHYKAADAASIPAEERVAIWGGDALGVAC